MTQLAKQTEALESKGIVVITIQATKIDQNALDEWVKKYNLPFSTMIEGDTRKIRFSWGVKSLPWLILTDRKGIVRTEGFRIEEIEDKFNETGE
jgi:hypothetical protein